MYKIKLLRYLNILFISFGLFFAPVTFAKSKKQTSALDPNKEYVKIDGQYYEFRKDSIYNVKGRRIFYQKNRFEKSNSKVSRQAPAEKNIKLDLGDPEIAEATDGIDGNDGQD